ncbi:MAG TPA: lysophospholipid acyltransferase family protein [Methylomirabilota bacterium]|nr:lysophospholipid acyltransferase family protein [Methylomirabilota bacterium]
MIRLLIAYISLTLFIVFAGPVLILHAVLTGRSEFMYRNGVGGLVFLTRMLGVRVRVEGTKNVPDGACLFIANHTGNVDAPAIVSSIPRQIAVIAKKSLFEIPLVGRAFRIARFIPVDRSDHESALASVEAAVGEMKEGVSFLIYPEGTRSADGRLLPFKKGAFVLAIKAGVPIVPVACSGAHRIWPKKKRRIYPGEVVVRFCPIVDASAYTFEQRDALARLVHNIIAEALPPDQRPGERAEERID